jgi:cytochrome c oxidase subunit 2
MNIIPNAVKQVDLAFWYIMGFSFIFLTAITVVMIVFVVKYRRSVHPVPGEVKDNWKLELAWTLIPTFIALSMFYLGWSSYISLRDVPPGALQINVEAQMFSWLFIYPNDKESKNILEVPVGKPVKLTITSVDVNHSLFIPAFRVKVDAVKGMKTYEWFFPNKEGEYDIFCTEYCGTDHSDMKGKVVVVSEEEYSRWLKENADE